MKKKARGSIDTGDGSISINASGLIQRYIH